MFYGRALRVVLPEYDENNDKGVSDAEHQRSAASAFVAARPFAATGMFQPEDQSVFVDHLTDHHVVTTLESAGALSTKFLAERSPYAWSFGQALDQVESNLAEMVCRSLPARGNARYGGTTTLTPRKFAVLVAGKSPDLHWLREGLAGCGVTAKTFAVPVGTDSASHAGMLGQQTGLMLQLRDDGYTSLIYVGNPGLMPMVAADNAGYEPEWISSGIGGLGDYPDGSWSGMPATQIAHLIGLGTGNKPLAIAEDPARRACAQADCGSTAEHIINGFYRPLMLLAAGIQAAGPRLTPESFRVGLESLRYPNPRLAGDLVGVARVGVAPGTRSLMNDFGAFSWNPRAKTRSQRGTYSSGGASCLVHGAKRWLIESWPSNLDFTDNNPCY